MSKGKLARTSVLISFVALGIAGTTASNGRVSASTVARQDAESGAKEKTAGQEFKNVQLLRDLPVSELWLAMQFFAASLGVSCDHCHVPGSFEKDDKPAKQTARRMISMMRKIDTDNFAGALRVTCATCHQGHTGPMVNPPLASEPPDPANSNANALGVTVDELLDRYLKALGGAEAIHKVTSRTAKGTLTGPNGFKLQFREIAVAPDRMALIYEGPAGPLFKQGFNGSTGWTKGPNGVTTVSNAELERMKELAGFYHNVDLKNEFTSLKLAGKTVIGATEVFELRGEKASGAFATLYFDIKTGLLLRRTAEQKTTFGLIQEGVDFDDYRNLGGVKAPFLVKRRGSGTVVTLKYDEVNLNAKVDNSEFEKPSSQ